MWSMTDITHFFFFFNDTATTEIYTLSLHDALPISDHGEDQRVAGGGRQAVVPGDQVPDDRREQTGHHRDLRHRQRRSEEHTSELQSRQYLVCRLLLEKKKKRRHLTAALHHA